MRSYLKELQAAAEKGALLFKGGSMSLIFDTNLNHYLPFKADKSYHGYVVPSEEKANLDAHFTFVYFDDYGYQTTGVVHFDDIKSVTCGFKPSLVETLLN